MLMARKGLREVVVQDGEDADLLIDALKGQYLLPEPGVRFRVDPAALEDFEGNCLAVASYRLLPTPFALDQPFPKPKPEPATRAIDLPFRGKWHMGQGPFCEVGTHKDYWAYDLSIFDHTLHASPSGSQRVEEFYAWNKPVLAPESGRVSRKREDVPDRFGGKAYSPKLQGQTN